MGLIEIFDIYQKLLPGDIVELETTIYQGSFVFEVSEIRMGPGHKEPSIEFINSTPEIYIKYGCQYNTTINRMSIRTTSLDKVVYMKVLSTGPVKKINEFCKDYCIQGTCSLCPLEAFKIKE